MKKLSLTIIAILFLMGLISAFLPNVKPHITQISSRQMIYEINKNHYFTTDQVAKALMTNDPVLFLVDVRSPEEYSNFTLPKAINLPVDTLIKAIEVVEANKEDTVSKLAVNFYKLIKSGTLDIVFFSNGSELAEKAWIICKDLGLNNIYVMEGGLNKWFTTIIMPKKPKDWEKQEAFDLYEFRKVASAYFGGGSSDVETSTTEPAPAISVPTVQNTGNEEGGGCE